MPSVAASVRSVAGSLREVQAALQKDDWRDRFPTAYKIAGPHTHRAWTAAALGGAVFSAGFWLMIALGQGHFAVEEGADASAFAPTVATMYFLLVAVVGPAFVHTGGAWLDRWAERFKYEDSVLVFIGVGIALAAIPVTVATLSGPDLAAFTSALFLFGLPIVAATALTRAYLPRVLKSQLASDVVVAIAILPVVLLVLFLLGLYVAQGAEV